MGVDSDRNKVSFSMDSFAIEKKKDDADSCSEGKDPRDVKVAGSSGEEEESLGGRGESSMLMRGEDLSRGTKCISHRVTSIFSLQVLLPVCLGRRRVLRVAVRVAC